MSLPVWSIHPRESKIITPLDKGWPSYSNHTVSKQKERLESEWRGSPEFRGYSSGKRFNDNIQKGLTENGQEAGVRTLKEASRERSLGSKSIVRSTNSLV